MTSENVEKQLTEEKRHSEDQHSGTPLRKPDPDVLRHLAVNLGAFIIDLECPERHRGNRTGSDKRGNPRSLARNQPPLVSLTLSSFHGEEVGIQFSSSGEHRWRPAPNGFCLHYFCLIMSY
jgi:hypothetical protein